MPNIELHNRVVPGEQMVSAPQKFHNGEIHNWYRIVLGYSDKLVSHLIEKFNISTNMRVLDPFCGAGTTLVECMKRSIHSVGVDANPSSSFAAKVKINWDVSASRVTETLSAISDDYLRRIRRGLPYKTDPFYIYLSSSGMTDRGWISPKPLRKVVAIKQAIKKCCEDNDIQDLMSLCLVSELLLSASNVRFGPELYCGVAIEDADVWTGFCSRVNEVIRDLRTVSSIDHGESTVLCGDSRDIANVISSHLQGSFDALISSPPYPTEHDYTRNSRLELALLGYVTDRVSLQEIKRGMIRSHTKGIYKSDDDEAFIAGNQRINKLCTDISNEIPENASGFVKLYPKVVREYFGGMKRHFIQVNHVLLPGALAAYVVGDQASYCRIHIPTADILQELALECGFDSMGIDCWRTRRSTTTSALMNENILMLRKRNQ